TSVHIASPWLMCAFATWLHANPDSAIHPRRRDHRDAERYPAAPTRTNGVHASVPAKGSEMPICDAAIIIAIESPPTVEAIRPIDSLRRNQYSPRPARTGCTTMKRLSPVPRENSEQRA